LLEPFLALLFIVFKPGLFKITGRNLQTAEGEPAQATFTAVLDQADRAGQFRSKLFNRIPQIDGNPFMDPVLDVDLGV
jgi:hypothetical protein